MPGWYQNFATLLENVPLTMARPRRVPVRTEAEITRDAIAELQAQMQNITATLQKSTDGSLCSSYHYAIPQQSSGMVDTIEIDSSSSRET